MAHDLPKAQSLKLEVEPTARRSWGQQRATGPRAAEEIISVEKKAAKRELYFFVRVSRMARADSGP